MNNNMSLATTTIAQYRTKQELIYEKLYSAIVNNELKPGEHIILNDIAEQLGTSRTPVREALRQLESEGLVILESHKGFVVAELESDKIVELYMMRAVLEGLAARLASSYIDEMGKQGLLRLIDEMEQCLEEGDVNKIIEEMNFSFHDIIFRAAKADFLYEHIINLYVSASLYRKISGRPFGNAERVVMEHRELAQAVVAGDANRAELIARRHHINNLRVLIQHAQEAGYLFDDPNLDKILDSMGG